MTVVLVGTPVAVAGAMVRIERTLPGSLLCACSVVLMTGMAGAGPTTPQPRAMATCAKVPVHPHIEELGRWAASTEQDPLVHSTLLATAKRDPRLAAGQSFDVALTLRETPDERIYVEAYWRGDGAAGHLVRPSLRVWDKATGRARVANGADLHRFDFDRASQVAARLRTIGQRAQPDFDEHVALTTRLAALRDDPRMAALERYRKAIGSAELHLLGDASHALGLDRSGRLQVFSPTPYRERGWGREASTLDLEKIGVRTVAELDARVDEALARLAASPEGAKRFVDANALDLRVAEIGRYMAALHAHPDVDLLMRHHENGEHIYGEFEWHGHNALLRPLYLAQNAGTALLWSDGKPHAAPSNAPLRLRRQNRTDLDWVDDSRTTPTAPTITPATYEQLAAFGLTDLPRFEAHLAKLMMTGAGHPETQGATLAEARALLQRQIADAPKLYPNIQHFWMDSRTYGAHPRAYALLSAFLARSPDRQGPPSIVLTTRGNETLHLGHPVYRGMYGVALGGKEKTQLHDLRRLGVGTLADLDRLVDQKAQELGIELPATLR